MFIFVATGLVLRARRAGPGRWVATNLAGRPPGRMEMDRDPAERAGTRGRALGRLRGPGCNQNSMRVMSASNRVPEYLCKQRFSEGVSMFRRPTDRYAVPGCGPEVSFPHVTLPAANVKQLETAVRPGHSGFTVIAGLSCMW